MKVQFLLKNYINNRLIVLLDFNGCSLFLILVYTIFALGGVSVTVMVMVVMVMGSMFLVSHVKRVSSYRNEILCFEILPK